MRISISKIIREHLGEIDQSRINNLDNMVSYFRPRITHQLINEGYVQTYGKGRRTRYELTDQEKAIELIRNTLRLHYEPKPVSLTTIIKDLLLKEYQIKQPIALANKALTLKKSFLQDEELLQHLKVTGEGRGTRYEVQDLKLIRNRLLELIQQKGLEPKERKISKKSDPEKLNDVIQFGLNHLYSFQRDVMRLLYGLEGARNYTIEEVQEITNLSEKRIKEIHNTSLKKLERILQIELEELFTQTS